jgi:diphthine synthase
LDAKENGIKYKVIPGISITNYIAESGLDEYKFGRTVTVCYHSKDFEPDSFYTQLVENKKIGLHTLCLLDIKRDEKPERLMNCVEGIEVLEKIATNKKNTKTKNQKIPKEKMDFVGLIAMGSNKQKIIVGKKAIFESPEVKTFFPQALVVCGKLNPKEKEALEKLN